MPRIRISTRNLTTFAELTKTPTAKAIWDALPIKARANTWGDEIYFEIPVQCKSGPEAREVVQLGDLGYWPPGNAFCIFFGPTPASQGNEIRAASAVDIVGRVEGDTTIFRQVRSGTTITLERTGR